MTASRCRFCDTPLEYVFADLGMSPLANAYISPERLGEMEPYFPLRALVCSNCHLVQLSDHGASPELLFGDYAYFSSYSTTWLEHSERYAATMTERFSLGPGTLVTEVASNDGYLLQYFARAGTDVLGVEPAANVAAVAESRGIPTVVRFFGRDVAAELRERRPADLLIGNNVFAHVPAINDFVEGFRTLLSPTGVVTIEFPHLLRLMEDVQFDTIYHEHFSYFSFAVARRIFARHGLTLFDVDEIPTHGGSLRIYARHEDDDSKPIGAAVDDLLAREENAGLDRLETYVAFAERVKAQKRALLLFLVAAKDAGASVVGYGAPAKGNTLLNYCGIGPDFVDYTVDRSPHKQSRYLPGSRIPIRSPDEVARTRPDYLWILPWNLKDEIVEQMSFIREWGGRFVVATPELAVLE